MRNTMGTEQKVAVITGASQGFGAGLVKAYRDRNYRVIANSRSIKPSNDSDVLTVAGDVADPKTADRIVEEGLARFGRIDTLINNAGIFIAKPLVDYTDDDYASVVAINLGGFFRITRCIRSDVWEKLKTSSTRSCFWKTPLSSLERSCMSTVARAPVIKQRGAAARPLLFLQRQATGEGSMADELKTSTCGVDHVGLSV